MTRLVFLLHRYLGIALGLVVLVWCLSGIVMMYVQYPELTPEEEVRSLDALDLTRCCTFPAGEATTGSFSRMRIEMFNARPVLRVWQGRSQTYWDLITGERLGELGNSDALAVAAGFARHAGVSEYELDGPLTRDQWTVYGAYDPHRPLFKFTGFDADATQWYVSSTSGEIVQVTGGSERFWNWLGAVPHWLYPTLLRQHTQLWSQIVIWLTIFGTFLTVLGLYVGIRQFKSRRSGRYSPYRGAAFWHHYAGLLFGSLTLVWLISGFFSMNPWGALESRSFADELNRHRGGNLSIDESIANGLSDYANQPIANETVRLDVHVVAGERFFVAWDRNGVRYRVDSGSSVHPKSSESGFITAARRLRPGVEVLETGWLHNPDAYYYDHHEKQRFPVYRISYADGERFYLDPITAEVLYAVDTDRRLYRWLHYGLHRGDFAFMRERPVWDAIMLLLLGGVTIGVATGVLLGLRRMFRWLRHMA